MNDVDGSSVVEDIGLGLGSGWGLVRCGRGRARSRENVTVRMDPPGRPPQARTANAR